MITFKTFGCHDSKFHSLINIASSAIEKHIILPKNITVKFIDMDSLGCVLYENPNVVYINRNIETIELFFTTFIHELLHVEQYFTGRLKNIFKNNRTITVFDNIEYDRYDFDNSLEYPWERDVRSKEIEYSINIANLLNQ